MKAKEIRKRIDEIRRYSNDGDHEKAHKTEDALRADFIRSLASHSDTELVKAAKLVLKSSDFDFERWCA